MNSRLRSLASAIRAVADACSPVLRPYRVKYFKRVPLEAQPAMFTTEWTMEIVDAYNREDAAQKVGMKVGMRLRPSYNCWVTRVMPGEVGWTG
jgi:hypothetical protein